MNTNIQPNKLANDSRHNQTSDNAVRAVPRVHRSTALKRATTSRGLKGLEI